MAVIVIGVGDERVESALAPVRRASVGADNSSTICRQISSVQSIETLNASLLFRNAIHSETVNFAEQR